jgi:hypothetical protein
MADGRIRLRLSRATQPASGELVEEGLFEDLLLIDH